MSKSETFRPMLGEAVKLPDIRYPVVASPKLDGVRCLGADVLLSRTMKPIPNLNIQNLFSALRDEMLGWDGELIVGDPTHPDVYNRTIREVMTHDGPSTATWYLFDSFAKGGEFLDRYNSLPKSELLGGQVRLLPQQLIFSEEELLIFEDETVSKGYEGLILRDPRGRYKYGRSTVRDGLLLKLKRFTDDEAIVIGFEELMHNANQATLDERGYTKRSSHAAFQIPANRLGALVVAWRGHTLRLGTGFTANDRIEIWRNQSEYLGKIAKFKYLPTGMKDLPRHPVWLGWRHPDDV